MTSKRDDPILILGENASDTEVVNSVLRLEYSNLRVSNDPESFCPRFDKVRPRVLLLAFKSLDFCESVNLNLHRRSTLLHSHLHSLGHTYGDFPAHDGLWEMCVKTQHDITARMALVPRTLEARGLDATPLIQARLRKVNTPAALRTVEILDVILRDEIGHVAIGNRWYGWLCAQQGLDPLAHYRVLSRTHNAPRLKPPFNDAARRAAGFSQQELDYLLGA